MKVCRQTLPAAKRRGVLASARPVKVEKTPAGGLVAARRVKRLPVLRPYRLPVFVKRPPFSTAADIAAT